ncbi:CDP-alcohol phosphatidyltransferase family protein [Clostridium botulinum]|nr:CDP-alcohol phosphatidyltransferase family protein [Clostridium botulinum]
MKLIPNCISFSRIIFSLILIYTKPLSLAFYVIYIICGLSDIMDGVIARKTGTTSSLGAKIDSIADMVMVGVLLFLIYPIANITSKIVIWIILISIIRLLSVFIAMKKYKIFASIHTYGNKITGIVLFLYPILLPYINTTVTMYIICFIASISAIEELIIQLISSQLELNKKKYIDKMISFAEIFNKFYS